MKLKSYLYLLVLYLIVAIFFWSLGVSLNFIIFFIISTFIWLYLSRYNSKFVKFIVIFIWIINFFLFVYALIPQPQQDIDIKKFFLNQQNCLKIFKNDSDEVLRKQLASVYILWDKKKVRYRLWEVKNYTKFCWLGTGDTIIFTSRTKNLKTYLTLYLWDWSIIRIFPKTKLTLDKVLKNLNDLPNSKTKISITEGNIRFRVIKLITNDEWFNVKTPDGILIIRGTAWFVSRDDKTLVYSDDHLIEGKNLAGDKFFIKWKEAVIFTKDKVLKKLDFNQFLNYVGENIYKIIKSFKIEDIREINLYKQKFSDYIKSQLSAWQQSNIIAKISFRKVKLNNIIFKNNDIITIEKIKILLWDFNKDELSDIDLSRFKNYIFIPVNEKYQEVKMKFFEQMSKLNDYWKKNYLIQKINNMLDEKKEEVNVYLEKILQKWISY